MLEEEARKMIQCSCGAMVSTYFSNVLNCRICPTCADKELGELRELSREFIHLVEQMMDIDHERIHRKEGKLAALEAKLVNKKTNDPSMTLKELCDQCNSEIVLYRLKFQNIWTCKIINSHIKDDPHILLDILGHGSSPQSAMEHYVKKIQGRTLVINAFCDDYTNFDVPDTLVVGE